MQNADTLETVADPLRSKLPIQKERVKLNAPITKRRKEFYKIEQIRN